MALIVTPGALAKRAEFYFQLSAMIRAGLPLIKALETLQRKPPGPGYAAQIERILHHLQRGSSFAESLAHVGKWISPFDQALLEAGERSGRLDQCFKTLASYYEASARRIRDVISKLLYPVGLLHFALLIFPVDRLVAVVKDGDTSGYLSQKLGVFLPAYLIALIAIKLLQSQRFAIWRAFIERILGLVPFVGGARQALALGRLTASLEALINAGVGIIEAWELAGEASGSPRLNGIIKKWRPLIESGAHTPGDLLARSSGFPSTFASIYQSGEISGQIDDALLRLRDYYDEESKRKLDVFTKMLVTCVILGVMLTVGYFIISFYGNLFKGMSDTLNDLQM
jgi:type II secretory pathway component PulF